MKTTTTKFRNVTLLVTALSLNSLCVNAQWALTGNPAATNTSILGATGASINLRLFAGGAAAANERIRILGSNGNVGIGTIAPTTKLHVVGTSRLQGATAIVGATTITGAATISGLTTTGTLRVTGGTPGLNKILRSDANGLASWITNPVGTNTLNKVSKWNGTQLVTGTIFDNGNIGIGTSTPAYQLHIQSVSDGIVAIDGAAATSAWTYYLMGGIFKTASGYRASIDAHCLFAAGDDRLVVSNVTGNVGIGTTTPGSKLSIVGDGVSTSPVVQVNNSYVGTADVRGISSYSKAADGWGYGIEATGGYKGGSFDADAGAYVGGAYGVIATASGTAGTRYGVYGTASGSGDNWGGYFPTKTYTNDLRVGGTQGATGYVASINGKLIATEVRVALQSAWPDYVFKNDYKLMSIHELEESIKEENHLPGLPSACEVEENGLHLGEMQTKIVEKLEESHLYIIQLQKQIDELKVQINQLKK